MVVLPREYTRVKVKIPPRCVWAYRSLGNTIPTDTLMFSGSNFSMALYGHLEHDQIEPEVGNRRWWHQSGRTIVSQLVSKAETKFRPKYSSTIEQHDIAVPLEWSRRVLNIVINLLPTWCESIRLNTTVLLGRIVWRDHVYIRSDSTIPFNWLLL